MKLISSQKELPTISTFKAICIAVISINSPSFHTLKKRILKRLTLIIDYFYNRRILFEEGISSNWACSERGTIVSYDASEAGRTLH